jgi:hypothetical protein
MTGDRTWEAEFRPAAATFDRVRLDELGTQFAAHLYTLAELPRDLVRLVLYLLRQNLRYEALELVADAALAHDIDMPVVRRQYAQALVDGGNPAVASRLYGQLADDPSVSKGEQLEARGGLGRCYKDLFLACTEPTREREYLRRAAEEYLAVYRADTDKNTWHGINAVALLARALRDDMDIGSDMPAAQSLAEAILATVDELPFSDMWSEVTACEALIALGRPRPAVVRAEAFMQSHPDGFTVASFHRQLRTVWQLDTSTKPGDELLPLLRSAVLDGKHGGQVTVEATDVRAARLDALGHGHLEKVLGTERFQSLRWYRQGLVNCRAVARVQTAHEDPVGTGFLVAGRDLHADLPELVLLTNGHVVPEVLHQDDAMIVFHGLEEEPGTPPHRFRVRRLCWYQPSTIPHLDTAILELDGYPPGVTPVRLARALPVKPLQDRRAYVIGHPRGLDQPQFSLQDNILLDYDDRVLHYRSPTDGGSSGSPVFNNAWELIGLHHSGGIDLLRLNNGGGTYAANEGIVITAIRDALAASPPDPGRRCLSFETSPL